MARLHLSQPLCRRIRSSIVMGSAASFGDVETTIMPHGLELPAPSSQLPARRALGALSLMGDRAWNSTRESWKLEAGSWKLTRIPSG